ncbi:GPR endopeptidase [Candidatus Epulonipiscium fishelsonii]|uniref:GPR endopeptidase n=1 Tax=Candidatus Epulonipiscium fishelsonii TaxID=77094 RepID=A0ACC8XAD0_9FIRM|nr:GPR endopeptidase [Epulopiscium sp. SCG-B11WGA-EpuloA1]ONI43346.1 GPR endopeptidase [Epulopiscium sp. SCG-B05WGA-EpuloA1]
MFRPQTDLAIEVGAIIEDKQENETTLEGVSMQVDEQKTFKKTHIEIINKHGEEIMGKPIGKYITIESQSLKENNPEAHKKIIQEVADIIKSLLPEVDEKLKVLVIGLGNRQATPDTLGPYVTDKVFVTRHLMEFVPAEIEKNVANLSSLAPGVMGLTGIETSEIVKGTVEHIKPHCIIAIDALGARSASRINTTIQITNTGISPGAGIGNKRKQLNESTIGCPVIAIGVPTVVDAATLVNDTMDYLIESMLSETQDATFYQMLKDLGDKEKYSLIKKTITPTIGNLFVTPKDIDEVIMYLGNVISNAINIAVHPSITIDDINKYAY